MRALPQITRMIAKLLFDPRLPRSAKLTLLAVGLYLASPIDLIPDFIPVAGYLDDALLAAVVLDGLLTWVDRSLVLKYWPGTSVSLDKVARAALERVESNGIIFLDELDKIAGRETGAGPDVSREGVQRDLLPIVEGSNVQTRYGSIKTDHILFIAAGSFYGSKPSDLIPELQGRFPLRVELQSLTAEDFVRILTEPENALLKQYQLLLGTEGVVLDFTKDGIEEMAKSAMLINERSENIGARRLNTVVEKVLDKVSFDAAELEEKTVVIDRAYVLNELGALLKNEDLSRYIL